MVCGRAVDRADGAALDGTGEQAVGDIRECAGLLCLVFKAAGGVFQMGWGEDGLAAVVFAGVDLGRGVSVVCRVCEDSCGVGGYGGGCGGPRDR